MRSFDLIIGESAASKRQKVDIKNPYDGRVAGEVTFGGPEEMELAVQSACDSFSIISSKPAHERATILRNIAQELSNRRQELGETIRDEAGKPVASALREVDRAVMTFSFAADEALRIEGDLLPMDNTSVGIGRIGLARRFPIGPILGVTPFNFPLNLVSHKVAPAIASGNSLLLKPSSQAPMSALILSQIARDAGLPAGALNVVPCPSEVANAVIPDPRLKMLTFTGSAAVGWSLRERAGKKRVTLELGGNAGTIVEPDVDLADAARKLAVGAFSYAGQVCISVQRVFVHESIYDGFIEVFLDCIEKEIIWGDPADPDVLCGPMIDSANADRIEEWIAEAQNRGAKVFRNGERKGNLVPPTVLTDVDPKLRIACNEAFGPVAVVDRYTSFGEALNKVNDSVYGLQAGIFTHDIGKVMQAFRELEVGAIIHNDSSVFRTDPMPYGGVKESGLGREGLRSAIEEMAELKLLVLRES